MLSFLYRASFQRMEWKPTDGTILFVYCRISTCFGPTGPSSGEFTQLFTQPFVQCLCGSVRVLCVLWPVLVTIFYFQHMEWKPTDVTILFVYCRISTCFGPTGPSLGVFVQLFTQPLVQYLCRSVRVLCMLWSVLVTILYSLYSHQDRPQHTEHANRAVQILNQWLCEQLYELSWRWACGPETCRDPAIYE
jgi:hypothetical protein